MGGPYHPSQTKFIGGYEPHKNLFCNLSTEVGVVNFSMYYVGSMAHNISKLVALHNQPIFLRA